MKTNMPISAAIETLTIRCKLDALKAGVKVLNNLIKFIVLIYLNYLSTNDKFLRLLWAIPLGKVTD